MAPYTELLVGERGEPHDQSEQWSPQPGVIPTLAPWPENEPLGDTFKLRHLKRAVILTREDQEKVERKWKEVEKRVSCAPPSLECQADFCAVKFLCWPANFDYDGMPRKGEPSFGTEEEIAQYHTAVKDGIVDGKMDMDDLFDQIAEAEDSYDSLEYRRVQFDLLGEVEKLKEELAQREADLTQHEGRLAERDGELAGCITELQEEKARLAERDSELARRDGELALCKAELEGVKARLAERNSELASAGTASSKKRKLDKNDSHMGTSMALEVTDQRHKKLAEFFEDHRMLSDQVDSQDRRNKELENEKSALEEQLRGRDSRVTDLEKERSVLKDERSALEGLLRAKEEANKSLADEKSTLGARLQEKEDKITNLDSDVDHYVMACEKMLDDMPDRLAEVHEEGLETS